MHHSFVFFAAFTLLASAVPARAALDSPDLIRVRTHQRQSTVTISGLGLALNGQKIESESAIQKQRLKISFMRGQWQVTGALKKLIGDRELSIEGDFVQVGTQPVADHVILAPSSKTRFNIISELALDDYLKGVLPSEMPVRWPLETLKAQVVASRSYALSQMREHQDDDYHLDDSVMHQVFSWGNFLHATSADQARIMQAIDETHGEILRDEDGEAYTAYFHSDCGGHTEEPGAVWGTGKKNGTVRDAHCALSTRSAWHEEIARDEFARTLAKLFSLPETARVASLEVGTMSGTGRVQTLLVGFEGDPHSYKITGQTLRQTFGFSRIKSTNFQFELGAANVSFSGRGNGHGVGLCQQGARFMAMAGADHREILHRYYPHAKL